MIAGLILAGGQGRRMGGLEKALLDLGGRPLAAHVAARLGPQVGALALSANGPAAGYAGLGLPVLPDAPEARGEGPLAGVLAGLVWAEGLGAEALVTVACDTPFLPEDLVARLARHPGGAYARAGGRDHPTAALWPCAARGALAARFAGGERRMRAALSGAHPVEFAAPPDPFANLNTPEDLAAAAARLAAEGAR